MISKRADKPKAGNLMQSKHSVNLSHNKQIFLRKPLPSIKLSASAAQKLVRYYNEKHNIQIIFNGDTEYGKQKIAIAREEIQKKIANYNDEKKKYAAYLQEHWLDEAARYIPDGYYIGWDSQSDFSAYHKEIKAKISPFMASDSTIWKVKFKELSTAELEQLNEIGKKLSCTSLLEDKINRYIQHLESEYHDVCLPIEETLEEIKLIQASLKNDEPLRYLLS